jgi:hypothetical protein
VPLLAGGLISKNAIVRIESVTTSQDAEGGYSESFATLTDDVDVLLSQVSASRSGSLGGSHNVVSGTLTGANASMARADVRYFVKTTSVWGLTGIYLFPESAAVIGASGEGVMAAGAFYRVKFSTVRTT